MAKEEKKVEEVTTPAPKKEQPSQSTKPEGKRQTTLPNGTVRTDH